MVGTGYLGYDAAGVVDEVGDGVAGVSVGAEVLGQGRNTQAEYAVLDSWAGKRDQGPQGAEDKALPGARLRTARGGGDSHPRHREPLPLKGCGHGRAGRGEGPWLRALEGTSCRSGSKRDCGDASREGAGPRRPGRVARPRSSPDPVLGDGVRRRRTDLRARLRPRRRGRDQRWAHPDPDRPPGRRSRGVGRRSPSVPGSTASRSRSSWASRSSAGTVWACRCLPRSSSRTCPRGCPAPTE
jgi:hypothetical protein